MGQEAPACWRLAGGRQPQGVRVVFAARVPCCSVVTLPCFRQTTHWLEILQALLLSPSQELQHRGAVVVLNMVEASREIASTLMESEVLEILSVLAKDKESPVTRAATACLGKAVEYGLIKPSQDGK